MTMREILFRGKHSPKSMWDYGDLYVDHDKVYIGMRETMHGVRVHGEVIPDTVGQFTGLTDKNGKKIYEGDILSTENGTFSNTGMGYILLHRGMWTSFYGQDALGRDCFDVLHTVCSAREVIGNIHDNPDLMEGEHHG